MNVRALLALLLLGLWTLSPGMGVAWGGVTGITGPPATSCECCCETEQACFCAPSDTSQETLPLAAPSPSVKLPVMLPSEPMWKTTELVVERVASLPPAAPLSQPAANASLHARFCTFLL